MQIVCDALEAMTRVLFDAVLVLSYVDGLGAGMVIGLPCILQFGPKWMKEKVGSDVLSGKKRICLAITEPYGTITFWPPLPLSNHGRHSVSASFTAGSDVANLQCTATKSADGKHYIVNGEKKWITK